MLTAVVALQIMFWNLNGNMNDYLIADIIDEHDVDIALFAEYSATNFENVIELLNGKYQYHPGYGGCEKISLVARKEIDVSIRREQNRYAIYTCVVKNKEYIVAGVHLPANPSSGPADRKIIIRDIVQDVSALEKEIKNQNTIVVGDFNASPFDSELIEKDAFNAVLYKDLIMHQESVTTVGKKYRRFYNPMLDYISEKNKLYGSLYYSSGATTLYWYCYDQIIVRKALAEQIQEVLYCREIKGKKLIKEVLPDKTISDHLPLIARIKEGLYSA